MAGVSGWGSVGDDTTGSFLSSFWHQNCRRVRVGRSGLVGSRRAQSRRRLAYNAFTDPQMVTIRDTRVAPWSRSSPRTVSYLLFNTSNVAPEYSSSRIRYSSRCRLPFSTKGEIEKQSIGYLSGTPSLDVNGNLYFVSTRSYSQTLSTIYSGSFASGAVTDVHLVSGVSGGTLGNHRLRC